MSRIENHIILGDLEEKKMVTIIVDGKEIPAVEGEPILSALLASGIKVANISRNTMNQEDIFAELVDVQTV